jgi:hypothetical protein
MRPMGVAIRGVGLATAQGGRAELLAERPPRAERTALGIDAALRGPARLAALLRTAFADCFGGAPPPSETPLLLASCNGGAAAWDAAGWRASFDFAPALRGTPWEGQRLPVASGACASGLQALHLAARRIAAGAPQAVVLAVDIDTPPARDSFAALRILDEDSAPPWHPRRMGFRLGEAAVALWLVRADDAADAPQLGGPVLGHDLDGDDGLDRVLSSLPGAPALVLGQGTGPPEVDSRELAAIGARIAPEVPLSSALHHFGHTLGASALLSVALAWLARRASIPRALALPMDRATDGRPLVTGAVAAGETRVVCRALGGACGACTVGGHRSSAPVPAAWHAPAAPPPLRDPVLRRLAAEALAHRPAEPPELLLVHLAAPLVPPSDARIGGRLLPSSILEMTPGFAAQLIARAWGFRGPAIATVGGANVEPGVHCIDIDGEGHVRWSA